MTQRSETWSSQTAFIFAASAAAIGLGNIWRFPYMVGENGGGIFVLMYLVAVIVLGLPLVIAEVLLGRMGRTNAVGTFAKLAKQSDRSIYWSFVGGLSVLAGFLIMTYYVVIAGWVLDYLVRAVLGQFHHINEASSIQAFKKLQANHWQMLLTDSIVCLGALAVLILGLKKGLERAVLLMFPALPILLALLLVHAIVAGAFSQAIHFLFYPDWQEVTAKTALMALGQAFFSLNIAMGVTITCSAYVPRQHSVTSSAIAITLADTGFALLSGLIIFPIVFAFKLTPAAGPSLIFKTLPLAFGNMRFGFIVGSLSFLMLFFAAFSSILAVLEPSIDWLQYNCGFSRKNAVISVMLACWFLSLGTITSFAHSHVLKIAGVTFFKAIDFLTASIMLPLGGLLIAVFTGWLLRHRLIQAEVGWLANSRWVQGWRFILKYVAPLAILFILLTSIGIL